MRRRIAATAAVLGELLITAGMVLLLFVVYSLWWTNVVADHQADAEGQRLRRSWSHQPPLPTGPGRRTIVIHSDTFTPGSAMGFLHIPALGKDYSVLIKLGTGTDILDQGVAGVYEAPYKAAMPWEPGGNFALAAHRDGHGAKFHNLDRLRPGDAVVVETQDDWYVYRVTSTLPQTTRFNTGVVAPIPAGSGFTRPGRYITLTTCTPVYTSRYRMAVWGTLTRTVPVDAHRDPPAELR